MQLDPVSYTHLGDVTDGLDPLYAWILLSVTYVDPIRAVDGFPVILQLSKNYHELVGRFLHDDGVTVDVLPDRAPYPEILNAKEFSRGTKSGLRVLEPDEMCIRDRYRCLVVYLLPKNSV